VSEKRYLVPKNMALEELVENLSLVLGKESGPVVFPVEDPRSPGVCVGLIYTASTGQRILQLESQHFQRISENIGLEEFEGEETPPIR